MANFYISPRARWAVSVLALIGCTAQVSNPGDDVDTASGVGIDAGSGVGGAPGAASSDLPCDIRALVATKCQGCHFRDPPGTLVSPSDFQGPSHSKQGKSRAQDALERLQSTGVDRMPPAPFEPATAAELAAFSAWVTAGAIAGSCNETITAATDPYDTPTVCTSAQSWTGGNRESPLMRPGGECIGCHTEEREGPTFAVAGTVFPTPHEPDDCNGVPESSGAAVVITDANGAVHTLPVNEAGNFSLEDSAFAYPYQAKVIHQGRERVMVEPQKSGDCNHCHTVAGDEDAPGRIFVP